jgi:chemotaxis methyl-accepting protein methylase
MIHRRIVRASIRGVWTHLPEPWRASPLGQAYGKLANALVRGHAERTQYFGTFFLRNRPELELMRRLVAGNPVSSCVNIAILGCSKGAEVYSVSWSLRSARPDLRLTIRALDISQDILDFAKRGIYSCHDDDVRKVQDNGARKKEGTAWNTWIDQNAPIFERLTPEEMEAMFEVHGEFAKIRPWLREGITWLCGDAGDPQLTDILDRPDIVVANRFLCHMKPATAEKCLRNIARTVKPGGYLFVSGIDLDVRAKVAREMSWKPVTELIHEIHEGDSSLREDWPLEYWSLEPFSEDRPDWEMRYASVFQIGESL